MFYRLENGCIRILLLFSQADVLVNTAGETLDLRANACARAFLDAAGPTLQSNCKAIAPVKPGNIGTTRSAGNLNCKHVFHAVCGMWKNKGKSVSEKKNIFLINRLSIHVHDTNDNLR